MSPKTSNLFFFASGELLFCKMMTLQIPLIYLDARIQFPSPVERKLVQKKRSLRIRKQKKII